MLTLIGFLFVDSATAVYSPLIQENPYLAFLFARGVKGKHSRKFYAY